MTISSEPPDIIQLKPAFSIILFASAIVLFTTFGSVVVEFELLLPVVEPLLLEGICKYGNTSVNI